MEAASWIAAVLVPVLRDAGGLTQRQTAYSDARMRAEFGLGPNATEAIMRYPLLPLVAHCLRD